MDGGGGAILGARGGQAGLLCEAPRLPSAIGTGANGKRSHTSARFSDRRLAVACHSDLFHR